MDEPKKIAHYVNDPKTNHLTAPENKLYRPKINFVKAGFVFVGVVFGSYGLIYLCLKILSVNEILSIENKSIAVKSVSIWWKVLLIILVFTLKYIMIWFIRIYQRYAKSETRLRCCYTPSCSEYAILALKKYGALIGGIKAAKRLLRCGPPGGIDYP